MLYGIPYAYASTMTTTYIVDGPTATLSVGSNQPLYAYCTSGDDVTGGGYSVGVTKDVVISNSEPVGPVSGPNGWGLYIFNTGSTTLFPKAIAVCQTPVTVAGIGVPQFGSLYVAIALGAVVYFMLSRRATRKLTTSSVGVDGDQLA